MIDTTQEPLIPLAEACRHIPPGRNGKATHLSTLLRWILKGAKAPDGTTVRLDAVRLGARWMTSRQALQRFAEKLTPKLDDTVPAPAPRTQRQRQRASERAAAVLEKMGF